MLDVALYPRPIGYRKPEHIIVMLDIFRASSTICAALSAGAKEVIPVDTLEHAFNLKNKMPGALLCGERGGLPPDGFELGNSPIEHLGGAVANRVVLLTTTNGAAALLAAPQNSTIIIGGFVNASAVIQFLEISNPTSITFACAGNNGCFSYEDALCAGMFASHFLDKMSCTDEAAAAAAIYRANQSHLTKALLAAEHAIKLQDLGFSSDLEYCVSTDILSVLPIYDGQKITLYSERSI